MSYHPRFFSFRKTLFEFLEQFEEEEVWRAARTTILQLALDRLEKQKDRVQGAFHASNLHIGTVPPDACLRQLVYSVRECRPANKYWTPLQYNKFEAGHDAHARYQGWLRTIFGEDFQPEIPISIPEYNIVGTCDGILTLEHEGVKYRIGLEIKTADSKYVPKTEPAEGHKDQGAVYVKAENLYAMHYLYENKASQEITEFRMGAEDLAERWSLMVVHLDEMKMHLGRGTLPLRQIRPRICDSCSFVRLCAPFATHPRTAVVSAMKEIVRRPYEDPGCTEAPEDLKPGDTG